MDFEKEEKEIRKFFGGCRFKKPPQDLMKNYEEEVQRKIAQPPSVFGLQGVLAIALVVGVLAVVGFFVVPSLVKPKVPVILSEPSPARIELPPSAASNKAIRQEELFERVAEDILILEILGEDEGLMEDFDSIETDAELLIEFNPVF